MKFTKSLFILTSIPLSQPVFATDNGGDLLALIAFGIFLLPYYVIIYAIQYWPIAICLLALLAISATAFNKWHENAKNKI